MKRTSRQQAILEILRAIKPPPPAPKKRLESVASFLTSIRSIVTSLVIVILVFVLLWIGIREFKADYILIEPFDVPQALEKQGLNGRVIANKLYNQLNVMREQAGAAPKRTARTKFIPTWSDKKVDMQVPGTGISIGSAILYIKGSFKKYEPTRIVGEIVTHQKQILVTIRVKDMPAITIPGDPKKLDELLERAGEDVCKLIQPYVLASYLYSTHRDEDCLGAIQHALSHGSRSDEAWAYTLRGVLLADGGDRAGAVANYKKAIEIDPEFVDAYVAWGNELFDEKKFDEAIANYEKAIAIDPKLPHSYRNWGMALKEQGNIQAAIAKYEKAIAIDPKFVDAYNDWGIALADQGNTQGAITKYEKAIEIDPKFVYAYDNLGVALSKRGDVSRAIVNFRKATQVDPKFASAYHNWGIALADQKNFREAIAKYRKAIQLDPKDAYIYNALGFALQQEGDLKGAIRNYQKALEFDPKYAIAYNNWGLALEQARDIPGAITKYRKATELDESGEAGRYARRRLVELKAN